MLEGKRYIWQRRKMPKSVRLKKSKAIKLAYRQGRMAHMKKVWADNRLKWRSKSNPRWKPYGSKRFSHDYTLVKTKIGWIKQERLIMQKHLGRKLLKNEIVHHKNYNKSDNRLVNLVVMTQKKHKAFHTKDNLNR